ncbi:hypothetical protein FQR65_LT11941 [Abscondita terminalis]|nr:hypothetical protein FQR65_LT11941 [Abscondita terminalis]
MRACIIVCKRTRTASRVDIIGIRQINGAKIFFFIFRRIIDVRIERVARYFSIVGNLHVVYV